MSTNGLIRAMAGREVVMVEASGPPVWTEASGLLGRPWAST
jgi:hypothetical protein